MAWSYSGDPKTSEKDKYRFLIGDTNVDDPILQDEEIEFIISEHPNHNMRLYQLYDRAADYFARKIKRTVGPIEEDPTERLQYFKQKAEYYKMRISTPSFKAPKISPPIFYKGMHDND
ncbi:MAG: hypothetical protein GX664_03905 [Bacteroidales bacterium]|nr:hypothetical protein [Bacteroidales bacterium]